MKKEIFKQFKNGIILNLKTGIIKIYIVADNIARVNFVPSEVENSRDSLVVIKKTFSAEWNLESSFSDISIIMKRITLKIDIITGAIRYYDQNDNLLLAENPNDPRTLTGCTVMNEKTRNSTQRFMLTDNEGLYGLGQYPDGIINYRGKDVIMVQTNPVAVNPFLISTKGYGILWDNYSKTLFHDGNDGMSLWSEVADGIDYYFIHGNNMDEVISGYRDLTGKAQMFGKWAYGYWQSKERYIDSEDVLNTVKEYRKRQIPIDNIVQDWRYWGENDQWSSMKFDPSVYPDPEGTIAALHNEHHIHFMVSIWPAVGPKTEIYKDLKEKGHIYLPEHWTSGYVYDAYSEEARNIYWRYIKDGLIAKGVDALWMDATEVELRDQPTPDISEKSIKEFGQNALGTMARYLNPYSLMTTKGVYEGFRKDFPDKRVFILTRSVFSGQQRYASVTWSGDISANWEVLKNQIPAGINFCMAGVPYWTHDIGAFFCKIRGGMYPEGCKSNAYRELYVRWFQFGAFTPIFRSHGTETPREVWQFGERDDWAYEALVKYDNLRYRLLPYIYSLAWKVTNENYTIMRGLQMDFTDDENTFNIGNQYMFGPSIMVIPVTEEQYYKIEVKSEIKSKSEPETNTQNPENVPEIIEIYDPSIKSIPVYLPKGADWYDFWTGEKFNGGQVIYRETPIDIMPVFIKDGSITPFGPFKQYSDEMPEDPIELRIYPGENSDFTLYEDENDNYNYEKGIYSLIPIKWIESSKTLILGERKGEFPGMLKERTFNVVIVSKAKGVGIGICDKIDFLVNYDGSEQVVDLEVGNSSV